MSKRFFGTAAVATALTLSSSLALAAYQGGAVSGGGSISGTVKFNGTAPAPKSLDATKDKEVCGQHKILDESLVVGSDGALKNAVVSITNITKGKAHDTAAKPELDQKGCVYIPHVMTAPAGAEIQIKNSDGILHNIHTYSSKNTPINRAQPKFKKVMGETFKEPETIRVTCDAHGWMQGWIVVTDHPYYAVTDDSGNFKLTDVPPGDYELKVWHEKLGEQTQKVTVAGGGDAKADFTLAAK
ncbi:MAG TPA: carboxypeptidase regulatory-like domain-containing protein [Terriglobales bacterium]|nr:carboxypeptidase regulatory-like domain-containing protein [Terriglobales bacterium]